MWLYSFWYVRYFLLIIRIDNTTTCRCCFHISATVFTATVLLYYSTAVQTISVDCGAALYRCLCMCVSRSGWVTALSSLRADKAVGAIMIIVAILFTFCASLSVVLLKMVRMLQEQQLLLIYLWVMNLSFFFYIINDFNISVSFLQLVSDHLILNKEPLSHPFLYPGSRFVPPDWRQFSQGSAGILSGRFHQ